ncbi:MAG: DUF455 family protein [Bacteriovoracia bacterium]
MPQKLSGNSDKLHYKDFARLILEGETLQDKLLDSSVEWEAWSSYELPVLPGRKERISFSEKQMKFPKVVHLKETEKKAMALHSFANHELLAIEMMAAALLIYPHHSEDDVRFKRGILSALKEEQKHLQLYIGRIQEFGYDFGDFPLNDFFWRQMPKLRKPEEYTAVMSLTFEAANLDFAQYYSKIFRELGDDETAAILDIVLEDEIGHVAFGAHWMKKWRQDKNLWDYYLSSLPWPMTPARSKGISFDPSLHQKAMSDEDFIEKLKNYDDQFPVTKRS